MTDAPNAAFKFSDEEIALLDSLNLRSSDLPKGCAKLGRVEGAVPFDVAVNTEGKRTYRFVLHSDNGTIRMSCQHPDITKCLPIPAAIATGKIAMLRGTQEGAAYTLRSMTPENVGHANFFNELLATGAARIEAP